jgi:hypothetical protein
MGWLKRTKSKRELKKLPSEILHSAVEGSNRGLNSDKLYKMLKRCKRIYASQLVSELEFKPQDVEDAATDLEDKGLIQCNKDEIILLDNTMSIGPKRYARKNVVVFSVIFLTLFSFVLGVYILDQVNLDLTSGFRTTLSGKAVAEIDQEWKCLDIQKDEVDAYCLENTRISIVETRSGGLEIITTTNGQEQSRETYS